MKMKTKKLTLISVDATPTITALKKQKISKTWILLDNQSKIDVLHNKDLLRNIRKSDIEMKIHCNPGISKKNMVGDFPGYGTVWYHKSGISNIFSLANAIKIALWCKTLKTVTNLRSRKERDRGRNWLSAIQQMFSTILSRNKKQTNTTHHNCQG